MHGQWIGQYIGSSSGSIIVNLDDMGGHYEGVAFLIDVNNKLPATRVALRTNDKVGAFQFTTSLIFPINPRTRFFDSWDNVKQFYPEVIFPKEAKIQGEWNEKRLALNWTTDIVTTGSATLPKNKADTPSECIPLIIDWSSYKDYVSKLEGRRYLFRGQSAPWRLRTKFHRTGRANLDRFTNEDIAILHKHLSARTRHVFNLAIPDENGAFFNLV